MNSILLCLALFSVITFTQQQESSGPDMIIELFRHGVRGPLNSFYDNTWPANELGMLTPVGLRQHYILGKVLSEKYPDLIGSTYNYSNIYLLTDTTPRCIQSAGAHLYGMYLGKGPALSDNYPPELAIPPFRDPSIDSIADSLSDSEALPYNFIPGIINIVDQTNAIIIQGGHPNYCPNQAPWATQNENDALAQQAFQVFGETIANVNKLLPSYAQLTTSGNVAGLGDNLLIDIYENKALPGGITDPQLITNLTWAASWFTYHSWAGQQEQRYTAAYNLIEAILQQLADFRQGNVTTTAALYSGHDDNILAILAVFGLVNETCIFDNFNSIVTNGTLVYPSCYYPYFASDLIFEFYNETDTPYVRFFYNNQILPICNGQYNCSYDEFVVFAQSSVGNLTLESYFQVCGANSTYFEQQIGPLNYNFPQEDLVFVSKNNSINTDRIAAIIFAIICILLTTKIFFDKKKYTEEIRVARAQSALL